MKIISLYAENFKRLKAITIEPGDDPVVEISGRNGQGKSSALDAIWAAIQGAKCLKGTPKPIRDGAKDAEVKLDLGDYTVTRKWTGSNSYLTVRKAGSRSDIKGPQALLDRLAGDLCFDPVAFTRMSDKDQANALTAMLGLDIEQFDAGAREAYDERTAVNRELKRAQLVLDELDTPPPGTPKDRVDISSLLDQQRENNQIGLERERHNAQMAEVKRQIDRLELELDNAKRTLADLVNKDVPKPIDDEAFATDIAEAENTNRMVELRIARDEAQGRVKTLERESKALTQKIQEANEGKVKMLEETRMPVDGLSIGTDGLTFNGIPLKQCSSSEQLRVAIAITMAQTPELRVMRVEDGSILDSDSMAMLREMATEHDFQVWVEIVDDAGDIGVVISDGEVLKDNHDDSCD